MKNAGLADRLYVMIADRAVEACQSLPDAAVLADAYCGIIRAIHAELLYHGPERTRAIAAALWQIFDLARAA